MKRLIVITAAFLSLAPLVSADDTLEQYDALLERYVDGDSVRYEAWRENATDLDALAAIVRSLERSDPSTYDAEDRYALYINLYNAKTLQIVLDGNPRDSIRDLSKGTSSTAVMAR